MSQVLEYAKPKSVMPSQGTWALIIAWTLVVTAIAWIGYLSRPVYISGCHQPTTVLSTLRAQIELYKIQHEGHPPAENALVALLEGRTEMTDLSTCTAGGSLGPYVQRFPENYRNGWSAVSSVPGRGVGWVYTVTGDQFEIHATDETGMKVLPE